MAVLLCGLCLLTGIAVPARAGVYGERDVLTTAGSMYTRAVAEAGGVVAIGAVGDGSFGTVSLYSLASLEPVAIATSGAIDGWDGFGASIAAVRREFAVGAPGLGEVYVIDRRGTARLRVGFPAAEMGADISIAEFGRSVGATMGMFFVSSQPTSGPAGPIPAQLWAFDGRTGMLRWHRELPSSDSGIPVAASGRIVAVATGKSPARNVLLFDARSGAHLREVTAPAGARGLFAFSIHAQRSRLLVGSLGFDGEGAAYEYRLPGGTLARTYQQPGVGGDSQQFGAAVRLERGFALVGAPAFDSGLPAIGATYVFNRRNGQLAQSILPRSFNDSGFGASLATARSLLFVGYTYEWAGAVEVWERLR